jgi:glycosyltransferase involved in cell wall biosynthesis
MSSEKRTILLFADHYLPGYRAGGAVRTIANMVENLGDDFKFLIITRDRDLNENNPYQDCKINQWNSVGKASVLYLSPDKLRLLNIASLMRDTAYDVLYLNSFFSCRFTCYPLFIRRFGISWGKHVVLAPRGEFGKGALRIKSVRKYIYIWAAKLLHIYDNMSWQASSPYETMDITRTIGHRAKKIHVAPDLLPVLSGKDYHSSNRASSRMEEGLRVIFLSRISPIKNLEFLLEILLSVTSPLSLNIYGPIEDQTCWHKCQQLIARLGNNVTVAYCGPIKPESVQAIFSAHDVFVFPTQGENFGHVIYEALSAGTSVIVSDKTPWLADQSGALKVLPLTNRASWIQAIESWADFSIKDYSKQREAAYSYAKKYLKDSDALNANRKLFDDHHLLSKTL